MPQGQVAVDEVHAVHAGQGLPELNPDSEAELEGQGAGVGLQDLRQVGGVEVLLDQPTSALAVLGEVEAREEVRLLEPEESLAVLEEAGLALAVFGGVDHSQDREPGQLAVAPPPGAVDADLPALSQALFELEARDREGQGAAPPALAGGESLAALWRTSPPPRRTASRRRVGSLAGRSRLALAGPQPR